MGIWERLRASRVLLGLRGHFSLRGHRIEVTDVSYHSRRFFFCGRRNKLQKFYEPERYAQTSRARARISMTGASLGCLDHKFRCYYSAELAPEGYGQYFPVLPMPI